MRVSRVVAAGCVIAAVLVFAGSAAAAGADSARMSRAKDLIADEQWRRAIVELRAAYHDPAEAARDEAAFWLAHSLYQSGDAAGALESIETLERRFPRSRWVFPARSLKIEIAQRLRRHDLLWSYAVPPPPPAPPAPPVPGAPPAGAAPRAAVPVPPAPPAAPAPPAPRRGHRQWVMAAPGDPHAIDFERDLQIEALRSLMRAEPTRAEAVLKQVALSTQDQEQAQRAIFVLLQGNRMATVADIARQGSEGVTLAAVKELGFVRSPGSATLLRDLYSEGSLPVKQQVLRSLGRARLAQPLMQLARQERERSLRETAVVALGQAGARPELAALYQQVPDLKLPVITALFTAAGEDELIAIAEREREPRLRAAALSHLELLGSPRATAAVRRLKE